MATKWTIDSDQSDVLIQMKDSTITYLGGETNHFDGFVSLDEDQIEDASVEFSLDSNTFTSQKSTTALQNKNKNVSTIMLEINRALYLNEPSNQKSENYNQVKQIVREYIKAIKNSL